MASVIRNVAIIMAMKQEAQPFIEEFEFEKINPFDQQLPMEAFTIRRNNLNITVVINGRDKNLHLDCVGTQPATLAAFLTVKHFAPDLIVNAGTAGAFMEYGSQIGDVYLSHTTIQYHDRRIPIPGFDRYGMGNYPCLNVSNMAKALGIKLGNVSTGNSLDIVPTDLLFMKTTPPPILKEMEAAAIAWVAQMYQIPFIAVKSVTDLIDNDQAVQEEFIENLAIAANNLKKKLIRIVEYLENKTIQDLWGCLQLCC